MQMRGMDVVAGIAHAQPIAEPLALVSVLALVGSLAPRASSHCRALSACLAIHGVTVVCRSGCPTVEVEQPHMRRTIGMCPAGDERNYADRPARRTGLALFGLRLCLN
jgi:hypothetical protein